MKYVRKPTEERDTGPSPAEGTPEAKWIAAHPAIWEYLSALRWEGGEERQTATLLFFIEGNRWKVCLNDRECERSAWATGASLAATLRALEASLQGGTVEWRQSGRGKRR